MKLLIDTNIIIGLEDAGVIQQRFADLVRTCHEYHVQLFVHEASIEDVERDKDVKRRAATLSKIRKFLPLKKVAVPSDQELALIFGPNKKANDVVDAKLLHALRDEIVDLLVSEDAGLHKRAKKAGVDTQVLTVAEAQAWLDREYKDAEVFLPAVEATQVYSLKPTDPIFDELKDDYDGFDAWLAKARKQHRECWIVQKDGVLAAIIIRKDELQGEAGTLNPGPKIMKLCTFKVAESFRGKKLGEQLLKQALWHAQLNEYDLVYLTVFSAKQPALVRLIEDYGFIETKVTATGEAFMEKVIGRGPVTLEASETPLEATSRSYPRFFDSPPVNAFVVPIHPPFHLKLFPEFQGLSDQAENGFGKPGNSIEKVYLCRSPTRALQGGDLLFFYMTKGNAERGRQTITTVGVVKSVRYSGDINQVKKWTAKRSVYSDNELDAMIHAGGGPLLIIDFLLIGHCAAAIPLNELISSGILNSWPQSLVQISRERYLQLKQVFELGFEN